MGDRLGILSAVGFLLSLPTSHTQMKYICICTLYRRGGRQIHSTCIIFCWVALMWNCLNIHDIVLFTFNKYMGNYALNRNIYIQQQHGANSTLHWGYPKWLSDNFSWRKNQTILHIKLNESVQFKLRASNEPNVKTTIIKRQWLITRSDRDNSNIVLLFWKRSYYAIGAILVLFQHHPERQIHSTYIVLFC